MSSGDPICATPGVTKAATSRGATYIEDVLLTVGVGLRRLTLDLEVLHLRVDVLQLHSHILDDLLLELADFFGV